MENEDLGNLEEKLYSKIYHDTNSHPNVQAADFIITGARKSGGPMRYYQESKNVKSKQVQKFVKPRKFQYTPKQNESEKLQHDRSVQTPSSKAFVPYSSVLFSSVLKNVSKEATASLKHLVIVEGNCSAARDQNSQSIYNLPDVLKVKKEGSPNGGVVFTSPQKKDIKMSKKTKAKGSAKQKKSKQSAELIEILSSDDDNSVIYVENQPPPLIALESSSDDEGVKKQKRFNKKGGSPSTSSIISDDFIVRSDKSRLRDIFQQKKSSHNAPASSKKTDRLIFDEDTSNDSVYNRKISPLNKYQTRPTDLSSQMAKQKNYSGDDKITVSIRGDDDDTVSSSSTEIISQEKRIRYDSTNYNESDFTSLISSAIVKTSKERNLKKLPSRRKNSANKCEVTYEKNEQTCDLVLNISSKIINSSNDVAVNLSDDPSKPIHSVNGIEELAEEVSQKVDCEVGWNAEMKFFYNEYSYGRDFNLTNVRSFMPCDNWKISNLDRNLMPDSNFKKIRCRNCNEVGHKSFNCYRPKKKTVCFMCGEIGHYENKCPNSLCLRCGSKTPQFTTVCHACAKFARKRCPLCKNSFHDLDQCPDKWRRYHSTTVEDSASLNIACKSNNRVYCSICAKQGHFAENCLNKQKNGYITSSWFAISNKPSYSSNYKFDQRIRNNHVLQLMTYMESYFFNLKLSPNCQFYPKFKKRFLQEACGMIEPQAEKESSQQQNNDAMNDIKQPESTKNAEVNNERGFITLPRNAKPQPLSETTISESKIMIDLNQKQMLKSQRSQVVMLAAGNNVVLKFPEHMNPNQHHLIILGTVDNQYSFQRDLRKLFFECELVKHHEKVDACKQLPRTIFKIVDRVKADLQSIKYTGIKDAKRTLLLFFKSGRNLDYKSVVKHRRNLNVVFMGFGELKEGAFHMSELRKLLAILEKQIEDGHGNSQLDQNMKDQIWSHLKYIFSPIDHGNYMELFRTYKRIVQKKNSMKNSKND